MNRIETKLRGEVEKSLVNQGYNLDGELFRFDDGSLEKRRNLHRFAREEKFKEHIDFIGSFFPEAEKYIRDSFSIDVKNIRPILKEVAPRTKEEKLFRWWNLVWWSLPYSSAYGRQMRFIVWDDYHDSPMGLIGLQSPILSWAARDSHLGIDFEQRDYWVNRSMSAQRLGALPPYNKFLGGKLVASLMMSDEVRSAFKKKYHARKTLLLKRTLPADLLFITTTGAYGKSSVYNRLKFHDERVCELIGYTGGYGSFHIPDSLYENLVDYMQEKGYKVGRSFGNGPSVKMKNIDKAMQILGFKKGSEHGIKRAVYLFSFVKNLKSVIQRKEKPVWYNRDVQDIAEYWQERWAYKRIDNDEKTRFRKDKYIQELSKDLGNCKNFIKEIL